MTMFETRPGETRAEVNPDTMPPDAGVVFIGVVHSAWTAREDCPKNMNAARQAGKSAAIEIAAPWREGLSGIEKASHVIVLTWLHHAPRDIIVQKPRHRNEPSGVFSLRSPARPNPIGLHVARLMALDRASGVLTLEGIDVLDMTPVVDIKPYYASVDAIPGATVG